MREDGDIDTQLVIDQSTPAYTVRAVAERLGVPTPTLRSWTLRYGIGPQRHQRGRHRNYTEADIAILERMVALIRAGASPASAARTAIPQRQPASDDLDRLLAAAFRLDSADLLGILDSNLREHGVVATWDHLCRPAFASVVEQQYDAGGCIDVEHILSWAVTTSLHRLPAPAADRRNAVVLACTSNESHALPLEALRAALAEAHVAASMLGAGVPDDALGDALSRGEGRATAVLWAQGPDTADLSAVQTAIDAQARVFVAGPGWDDVDLPLEVGRIDSLPAAVDLLQQRAS